MSKKIIEQRLEERGHSDPRKGLKNVTIDEYQDKPPSGFFNDLYRGFDNLARSLMDVTDPDDEEIESEIENIQIMAEEIKRGKLIDLGFFGLHDLEIKSDLSKRQFNFISEAVRRYKVTDQQLKSYIKNMNAINRL
jgi:hypothetical protein